MAEEAWFSDQCKIFIQEEDGTEQDLSVKILNINESGFERETEGIVTFADGRITKKTPQADGNVELEVVLLDTTWDKILFGSTSSDAAPAVVQAGGEQNKHRVSIVRTADATPPSSATAATSGESYRRAYAECYGVTLEPENAADDFAKATITFRVSPTDKDGSSNIKFEYGTGGLSGLAAYTSSTKFA